MNRFQIRGNKNGSWQIISDGEEVASVSGPMSGCLALAAVEHMNSFKDIDREFFDGWTRRLSKEANK